MNNEELVEQILAVLNINGNNLCIKKWGSRKECSWSKFILAIITHKETKIAAEALGYTKDSFEALIKRYINTTLPKNKPPRVLLSNYLLSLIDYKYCSTCGTIHHITSFYKVKHTQHYVSACKYCSSDAHKKYYSTNKEEILLRVYTYYRNNREKVKLANKKYQDLNRDSINLKKREYYSNNREKIRLAYKKFYERNRLSILSTAKYYRILNKEKIAEYRKNNRYLFRSYDAKRRATKLKATPNWANLIAIKEIYRTCPKGYHVDHIVPLQNPLVCGLHCEFNLQHLPAKENLSKGNRFEIC